MNNIQKLVFDKVKALSLNQQKSVLNFIDSILSPNVINSDLDEVFDPNPEQIAASLHRTLHEVKTGQTKPISQFWDSLDRK